LLPAAWASGLLIVLMGVTATLYTWQFDRAPV
jgi:hypothetical protein